MTDRQKQRSFSLCRMSPTVVARSLCRLNSGSRPSISTELYGVNNPSFKAHSNVPPQENGRERPHPQGAQPFKAALENDKAYLETEGMPAILELFSATHTGMTDDEFRAEVREFMETAKHPKFGRAFGELTYQPMVELLEYLRSHGFKTYICSGGGIDFMAPFPSHFMEFRQSKSLAARERRCSRRAKKGGQ